MVTDNLKRDHTFVITDTVLNIKNVIFSVKHIGMSQAISQPGSSYVCAMQMEADFTSQARFSTLKNQKVKSFKSLRS